MPQKLWHPPLLVSPLPPFYVPPPPLTNEAAIKPSTTTSSLLSNSLLSAARPTLPRYGTRSTCPISLYSAKLSPRPFYVLAPIPPRPFRFPGSNTVVATDRSFSYLPPSLLPSFNDRSARLPRCQARGHLPPPLRHRAFVFPQLFFPRKTPATHKLSCLTRADLPIGAIRTGLRMMRSMPREEWSGGQEEGIFYSDM